MMFVPNSRCFRGLAIFAQGGIDPRRRATMVDATMVEDGVVIRRVDAKDPQHCFGPLVRQGRYG